VEKFRESVLAFMALFLFFSDKAETAEFE